MAVNFIGPRVGEKDRRLNDVITQMQENVRCLLASISPSRRIADAAAAAGHPLRGRSAAPASCMMFRVWPLRLDRSRNCD